MLLNEQKILFIHIPKTAGSSIENSLLRHYNLDGYSLETFLVAKNEDSTKGPSRLNHMTAEEYINYNYIEQSQYKEFFKFSFVRNPWSRLVSEYKWHRYYRKYTFKDWLLKFSPNEGEILTMKDENRWRHVMPQHKYIFSPNGECLVDFIGRFENLEADFQQVGKHLGECFPELSKIRESKISENRLKTILIKLIAKEKLHESYMDYYDNQTWQWVNEFYRKDIELLGY